MGDRFSGKLTLSDGEVVEVELVLDDESLAMTTDSVLIDRWPLKYCRVSRAGRASFQLSLDGEKVVFSPSDVNAFGLAAAQRFQATSLADRIGVVRQIAPPAEEGAGDRPRSSPIDRLRRLGAPAAAAAALVVVVIAVIGAFVFFGGSSDEPLDEGSIPRIDVGDGDVPPASPLLTLTPEEFVVAWNTTAAAFGAQIPIRHSLATGNFEAKLADYLTLQGTTDLDGTIASLVLVADPSGDTADDQLAVASWGIAIAVANPELDGDERRDVLERLGIDVRAPNLEGLDGEVEVDGIRYGMQYFPEFSSVLFSVGRA